MSRAVRYPNAVSGSIEFAKNAEIGEVVSFIEGVNKRARELGAVPAIHACAVSPGKIDPDYTLGTQVLVAFTTPDQASSVALGDAIESAVVESKICENCNFGIAPITLIT
jgi:hypothetical protein